MEEKTSIYGQVQKSFQHRYFLVSLVVKIQWYFVGKLFCEVKVMPFNFIWPKCCKYTAAAHSLKCSDSSVLFFACIVIKVLMINE